MKATKRVLFWAGLILLALGLWHAQIILVVMGAGLVIISFVVETAMDALESRRQNHSGTREHLHEGPGQDRHVVP